MAFNKPFYRNVRGMKAGHNSGYSGWAYIEDKEYSNNSEHYIRALGLIIKELRSVFEYVEPSNEGRDAFSYRIHALLMRTCIEIEANFKAILQANIFTLPKKKALNIRDFRKVDVTHHLSSYEAVLPMWNGVAPTIKPFEPWLQYRGQSTPNGIPLPWYKAYNESKHSRQDAFKKANLWALIEAVAGLVILVTSQFKTVTFDAGPNYLLAGSGGYHPFEHSIGELFRIKFPEDWSDDEIYDFDWAILKSDPHRFAKIDYDAINVG